MDYYRYKITIEYLGTGLAGWQRQDDVLSIQQRLEEAIYQFSREKVTVVAAGRTDAGVHALAQVAHFDLIKYLDPYKVLEAINHFLRPYTIGVIDCSLANNDFHARFSAIARHYMYRVINRPTSLVIDLNRAWWIRQPLDVDAMRLGAINLIGHHDFTSFRGKYCQAKSAVKTLSKIEITQENKEIRFYLSAPSFLHNMVRNIVGSLVLVGRGVWQEKNIKNALEAKCRTAVGVKAPAHGLYFLKADYSIF